ncbi:MAG TPA: hypothetical protein VG246_12020 [Acidimicrobiales bacterium]|nr:hypothetical protein [Acidimicrobiales bacterium]
MSTDLATASRPWWRRPQRSDRWAFYWFLAVPAVIFIVPALFGHPAIDADNLIQNFPLRVLAGRQIASGHLPLLDPLTNAGTPLLGGMNAGALYPLTVIFAFIPPIVAWLINMIVVYLTASIGVFALCRWHGLRTWPSFAAAICYTYSGAMIGQMVHLGVVQGYSFIPWALLLMVALSRRLSELPGEPSWRRLARVGFPWVVGVAILWGLTFLSGEPRGIASIELLTLVVVPCVLLLRSSYWLRSWRLRIAYLATLAVGFAWGVGLGLVQVLPGWAFINFSERSEVNYDFYGAGSLAVRWTTLLFTPDLFGGNGAFGQAGFFANYNLAEVTGYVGVLALIAGAAFLTRVTRKGWRGADRDWVIYLVIGVIGLFATWGSFTPLGHLFRDIPIYGSTRLQSRNVILVDFPLALFLGRWLQLIRDAQFERAGLRRFSRWIALVPAFFAIVLLGGLLGWGQWVIDKIGITHDVYAKLESKLTLANSLFLGVALLSVLAVVFLARHARTLFSVLMTILVVDLSLFVIFTSSGLIGGAGPREASQSAAERLLSSNGRFALVDQGGVHTGYYRTIGEPNMNVFTHMPSVQGYGALISTIYDNATGTHPQAALNACHLADGTFTQLRLGAIAISASELMTNTVLVRPVPRTCVKQQVAGTVKRYFGERLKVRELILTSDANSQNAPLSTTPLRLRFVNGSGHAFGSWYPATNSSATKAVFDFAAPPFAAGFELTSSSGVEIGNAVVTPYNSKWSYELDTNFELAIATSQWRLTSTQDTFSVFKATTLIPRAWLTTTSTGSVTNIRTAAWGDAWVSVALTKASTLERSEAYLPGWRATAVNSTTGRVVQLTVHRAGLIEKVDVPEGTWVIHFHYHAPYIELSVATSAGSTVLLILVALWFLRQSRRRRNSKVIS